MSIPSAVDTFCYCEICRDYKRVVKVYMVPKRLESTLELECKHRARIITQAVSAGPFGTIPMPSVTVTYS